MRTLPRAAQVTVGLFGIIGAYGLIPAIPVIGRVDYGYLGLLVFLAVVTARTKVRLIGGSSLSLMVSSIKSAATEGRAFVGALGRSILRLDLDDRGAMVAADPERDRAGGIVHEHAPHVG